ncbi:hypothetical protein HB770_19915 [Rhizobium leguminosarum bv. viciae]|uniref:Transmembrane protein n=1 Tax=Rhizobium leguminosarum bv. viciae TaxID=387 RepID=A0A7G6RKU9_RHILV|nr:hypothetical protein HB770_19915 [Rhizobium leguminosarum bv. viciae]
MRDTTVTFSWFRSADLAVLDPAVDRFSRYAMCPRELGDASFDPGSGSLSALFAPFFVVALPIAFALYFARREASLLLCQIEAADRLQSKRRTFCERHP